MDFRNFLDKAADKVKSVFSRDNSFFYGAAGQGDERYPEAYDRSPAQGVYSGGNVQNPYEQPGTQQPYYQNAPYQTQPAYAGYQAPYQQPVPQQAYRQPAPQQRYAAEPTQPFVPPRQARQAPQGYAPQMAEPAPPQGSSPQQMQLQQFQAESGGRNRRAAQHQLGQQPEDNLVQFPGAPQPEPEARPMDAYVVNVTNMTGCRQAMTCLRKGQCTLVVMDQLIDKTEVRRYVDMLNGACFALGGTMTRLSLKVGFYILAPSGMMVYTDPVTASANAPQARPAAHQTPGQPPLQGQPGYAQPAAAPYQAPPPAYAPQAAYPPPAYGAQNPYAPPAYEPQAGYQEERYAQ